MNGEFKQISPEGKHPQVLADFKIEEQVEDFVNDDHEDDSDREGVEEVLVNGSEEKLISPFHYLVFFVRIMPVRRHFGDQIINSLSQLPVLDNLPLFIFNESHKSNELTKISSIFPFMVLIKSQVSNQQKKPFKRFTSDNLD